MPTRPDATTEHGGHRTRWLAVLGVMMSVAGLVLGWVGPALDDVRTAPDEPTGPALAPYVMASSVRFRPVPVRPHPATGVPTRVVVPSLGIDVPVIPIGMTRRVLLPPGDPQTLGWWRDGARPGAVTGGALITGHTVHTGGGALDDLDTLDKGDAVRVRTRNGVIAYDVTGVTVYRKATLADDAERVFSQSGPGRLVLITCEDWNGAGYDSNAIVFAERRGARGHSPGIRSR